MTKNTAKSTILIGDSCAGGFGVLKEMIKWSDGFRVEYIADYGKNPFGLKSKNEIFEIVKSWFSNLVKLNNIRLVVIACNTASIASYDSLTRLSEEFGVPVVSMVDGVERCIESNCEFIKNKTVAIMATKYTIGSYRYFDIIKKFNPSHIINIIGTQAEHCVASGEYNSPCGKKAIVENLIRYKDRSIDTVVLGCTCFPLIADQIKATVGKEAMLLDPAVYVSNLAKNVLEVKRDRLNLDVHILNTSLSKISLSSIDKCSSDIFGSKLDVSIVRLNR